MQRKKQTAPFVVVAFLLFSLSCNLPFLVGDSTQFEDGLVQNYQPALSPVSQYTLSVTQQAYVDEHGYPDRFVIFFFDEMLPDGQLYAMRHESWYYDARGYEIVFRNGDKFTERNGEPIQIEGLGRTVYSPQGFTAEMNLDALLALRGENGFFVQNVDDSQITGELIFIQGLAAGFEEGRLSYIETLPLGESQPLTEASPLDLTSGGLTPQELLYQGTHTYEVSCIRDDGSSSNFSAVIALEFTENGVNWTLENKDGFSFFQKVDINTYENLDGGNSLIMIFTDLGIRREASNASICNYMISVLTPQELASQGQHTYLWACTYNEGADTRGEINTWKTTFDFIEGGVNFSGEDGKISFYSQAGVNTYEAFLGVFHSTIIFTDEGFTLNAASNDLIRICEVSRE